MSELETYSIQNPQLQTAVDQAWDLIKTLVRQMHVLASQNTELKSQHLKVDFNEEGEWIELNTYHSLLNNFKLLQDEYSSLKINLEKSREENQKFVGLGKENADLHSEIIEYKSKLAEFENLNNALAEKNLIIVNQNNEIHELKGIIDSKNDSLKEIAEKQEKIDILNLELENFNSEIEKSRIEIEKVTKEIVEKDWIIGELEKSLNEKRSNSDEFNASLLNKEKIISELQDSIKIKESEFKSIRSDKEKLEAEITKVKISNRELLKQLETIAKEKKEISLFDTHEDELTHFRNEKIILQNRIKELIDLNNKYKSDIQKTRSGLLPLAFGDSNDDAEQIQELRNLLEDMKKNREILENKLINLENLVILKSEEIQKLKNEFINYKEETVITNNKIKSKILDLKKFMLDKGII